MSTLVASLFSSLWPYLAAAGAGLVALWGVWAKAKSAGRKEQAAKQLAADKKAADTAHRIEAEVDALKPKDARDELKTWGRK